MSIIALFFCFVLSVLALLFSILAIAGKSDRIIYVDRKSEDVCDWQQEVRK